MGSGQTLPAVHLRLAVLLLVLQQQGEQLPGLGLGVGNGGHRLIVQLQPLPASGEIGVDGGGVFPQALDKVGPVVD